MRLAAVRPFRSVEVIAATWVGEAAFSSVKVSADKALSERPRKAAAEMPVIWVVGESACRSVLFRALIWAPDSAAICVLLIA